MKGFMSMRTLGMIIALAAVLQVPLVFGIDDAGGGASKTKPVSFRILKDSDFQSFIKNWDDKKYPALYALIQNPAQWDAIFHPAPVMGGQNRPYCPDGKVYEKEQIVVVARVIPAPDANLTVFNVRQVVAGNEVLVLYYRFNNPENPASYTIKSHLAVAMPKYSYKRIVFIENGKQIGILDLSKGQWSVPAMKLPGKEQ
jgi:hypothetical protein